MLFYARGTWVCVVGKVGGLRQTGRLHKRWVYFTFDGAVAVAAAVAAAVASAVHLDCLVATWSLSLG